MNYWFTADYHLGHGNIIEYCERPFKDVYIMNEAIIRNHNSRVKKEDTVFHIGDFCFKNSSGGKIGEGQETKADIYRKRLNGNIVFIKGNHDGNNSLKTIIKQLIIEHGGKEIQLVHDPMDCNIGYNLNFVGHVHQAWKFKYLKETKTILINVGVDVWRFMPVSFEEIMNALQRWAVENKIKILIR